MWAWFLLVIYSMRLYVPVHYGTHAVVRAKYNRLRAKGRRLKCKDDSEEKCLMSVVANA